MTQFTPATATRPNYIAIVSLIAGVCAAVGTVAYEVVPALIAGVIAVGAGPYALTWAKKHEGRGRVLAIIGIVLGAIPILFMLYAATRL